MIECVAADLTIVATSVIETKQTF